MKNERNTKKVKCFTWNNSRVKQGKSNVSRGTIVEQNKVKAVFHVKQLHRKIQK